ncbi:MAG: cytochrome c biogenesis factor [Pseudomonadota bacterium]
MAWFAIIALAVATFAIATAVLRLPKSAWTLFAAALVFGLAGYAWQGSTLQPASPKAAAERTNRSGDQMVDARSALFSDGNAKPAYLVTSDAFARKGRFAQAAEGLRRGLTENPDHAEGWLALGMALVEHADGTVTPAAEHAYEQAFAANESNPAGPFLLGFAYLRAGDVREGRAVWGELLNVTPQDAPWRQDLELRIDALDAMIEAGARPAPFVQQP